MRVLINQLKWYAWRLGAMSAPEIAYRVREQIKRQAFRRSSAGWERFDVGPGPLVGFPALREALSGSWPDDVLAETRKSAELIMNGELQLLGRHWPADLVRNVDPALWFLDPCTGKHWPGADTYCFDTDYRHSSDKGDVKFVWELNRLQFLHPLAALALQDRDRELYARILKIVLAWMDANPPFQGVNWPSGIELSMRLVTIALVVSCAPEPDDIDLEARRRLRSFVVAHVFWLARYPSLYSSANNHWVAEGLGLLIGGLMCPDLAGASHHLKEGRTILAKAPLTQFHPDGTGCEQSPTYAAFTLEMIALGLRIDTQEWLAPVARERLVAAGRHLHALLDDNSTPPRIGDDDEGRVVALPPAREERYVASVTSGLASVLNVATLAAPNRDPHLRDIIFQSPVAASRSGEGVFNYPDGGYTIVRQHVSERSMLLVFDHGPLGFLSIAAHGHADALAVWLHLDGQPVLVDAGTYLYHSGGDLRDHFRSTAAHNTLELGGESQSLTAGAFNWRHKAEARQISLQPGENWSIEGTHDGYRKRFQVEHSRRLRRTADGFDIDDMIVGPTKEMPATLRFTLHPSIQVTCEDGVISLETGGAERILRIAPPAGSTVEIARRGEATRKNLYSAAFDGLEATSTISIKVPLLAGRKVTTNFSILPRQEA